MTISVVPFFKKPGGRLAARSYILTINPAPYLLDIYGIIFNFTVGKGPAV